MQKLLGQGEIWWLKREETALRGTSLQPHELKCLGYCISIKLRVMYFYISYNLLVNEVTSN